MFRAALVAVVALGSSACALETAAPAEEDPTEEGALAATTFLKCPPKRWDVALTPGDPRTCASFAQTTALGTWTAFSTFPSAPAHIRDKRCAIVFTSRSGICATVTKEDLKLNCEEDKSLIERTPSCAVAGAACKSSSPTLMRSFSGLTPAQVALECRPPVAVVNDANPEMFARTYSGGCGNCATLWGGLLYLNAPGPFTNITFYNNTTTTPQPTTITLDNVTGPVAYNLSSYSPSGPVVVSY